MTTNLHDKMLKAIDALFSASDRDEEREAEDLLLDVRDELLKQYRKATQDAIVGGTGIMKGGERIDPASIYSDIVSDGGMDPRNQFDKPAQSTADKSELETVPAKGGLLPAPQAERLADALTTAVKQIDEDDQVVHVARWFVEDSAAELRRLVSFNQQLMDEVARLNKAPDYAWPTIADYEKEVGFEVNIAFRSAWAMARTTNDIFKQMGSDT